MPIAVFAEQRLERIGRQNEVQNVRCVATLYRNIPFHVICRNPSCTVPFRDNRNLPVSTCQMDSTRILLRVPLETPKDRLVICSGRLQSPTQMSFVSIRSQNRSSHHFRDLQFLDVLAGFVFKDFIVRPFTFFQIVNRYHFFGNSRHCDTVESHESNSGSSCNMSQIEEASVSVATASTSVATVDTVLSSSSLSELEA